MNRREELFAELRAEESAIVARGLGYLRCHMDEFAVQDFLDCYYMSRIRLARDFDYTEWRRDNVCVGMSVDEISRDAMEYCRSMGMYGDEEGVGVVVPVSASVAV
jgi:hypothetical protein